MPFFGIRMKTDIFQSYGHCWVFQIWYHIECSTLTASSFRIWNSSTGISSSPLALFVVMLPKAHLTSDSRISGSRWVITPSWLPESLRSYFYGSWKSFCDRNRTKVNFLKKVENLPLYTYTEWFTFYTYTTLDEGFMPLQKKKKKKPLKSV